MATLTLRAVKGEALTHDEVDDNFSNLNTDKAETDGATLTNVNGLTANANIDIGSYSFRAETLVADVAGGTPPLTITSTDLVTNLNADQLDGSHGAAYALLTNLASTSNGQGASLIGLEDSAGNTSATDVEAAVAELYGKADVPILHLFKSVGSIAASTPTLVTGYSENTDTDGLYSGSGEWIENLTSATKYRLDVFVGAYNGTGYDGDVNVYTVDGGSVSRAQTLTLGERYVWLSWYILGSTYSQKFKLYVQHTHSTDTTFSVDAFMTKLN